MFISNLLTAALLACLPLIHGSPLNERDTTRYANVVGASGDDGDGIIFTSPDLDGGKEKSSFGLKIEADGSCKQTFTVRYSEGKKANCHFIGNLIGDESPTWTFHNKKKYLKPCGDNHGMKAICGENGDDGPSKC